MATTNHSRLESTVRSAEDQRALEAALASGTIVINGENVRPFYFNGRYLTAADLSADQNYVRARQSDLAQAIGAGVVQGLMVWVKAGSTAATAVLRIEPGIGITPAGDLIGLEAPRDLRLEDVADEANLDVQLGVKLLPTAATRNRSGLYVLALRPVEFSANPVPAYPTSLDGSRSVHDGEIFEATAVTLIPYPDRAGSEGADAKRARVAREIFFEGARPGVLQEALPLAMVYLDNGALRWLDVYLVRREVGAESTLSAGLQPRPRALLEAWLQQHQDQYATIPAATVKAGFPATSFFEALPPVGWIPATSVSVETDAQSTFVQSFFPPLVDCEFAFVPLDEIPVLVAESLALPPIDLQGSDEDLDHLSVLIVAGVSRPALEQLKRSLENVSRGVRPAAPGMLAKRTPLETLLDMRAPRLPPPSGGDSAIGAAWRAALTQAQNAAQLENHGCFWYLRRRQLPYYAEITSATLRLAGDAAALDTEVAARLRADGVLTNVQRILNRMPRLAAADAANVIAAPRLAISPALETGVVETSDLLRRSAVSALTSAGDGDDIVTHAHVLGVAKRYGDPDLGAGFDKLAAAAPDLKRANAVATIVRSGVAPELDAAARKLPRDAQAAFATRLAALAVADDADAVRNLVGEPQ
jgi:hypothetical protein